jgi:serine/threonine protein phosphatase PrpC
MGTTLTVVVFADYQASLAHIGDCRAYLLRQGQLRQLTHDHTLVQEMVDAGSLTKEESNRHPQRNVLTRALGMPEYIAPDIGTIGLESSDRLLLCSDGLHGYVPEYLIRNAMSEITDPAELTQRLIQMALDHGGEDNITVMAVCF